MFLLGAKSQELGDSRTFLQQENTQEIFFGKRDVETIKLWIHLSLSDVLRIKDSEFSQITFSS